MNAKKRIFVIGNSHAASLKSGWDSIKDEYPHSELVFFAHRGLSMKRMTARKGGLYPETEDLKKAICHTSGGEDHIAVEKYSAGLLYGMDLHALPPEKNVFYSETVLAKSVEGSIAPTVLWSLVNKVRSLSELPIYLGHVPQMASLKANPVEDTDLSTYQSVIERMGRFIQKQSKVFLIPQPTKTFLNARETRHEFATGSTRLDIGDAKSNEKHHIHDRVHMNGEYGALFLKDFLQAL